ncbi:hypothetical protein [Actinomadura sp. DC4]|uniref:hypothetical protein n=1 Tax=Actinomadura sp. DC4 TaxID=3055069 RepID=UPI0025AF5FB5|nr:hypothetical protein [Actinomadura sp. DC4]MDN3352406.1 hypothetical protein [Actinomadura sp. DC4]
MARRLWTRFEFLPFRYGVALGSGAIVLAGVLVLAVTLAGGGSGEPLKPAASTGVQSSRPPAGAAVPPPPTFGAYVPPRRTKTTIVPVPRPRVVATTPRPKPKPAPTHTAPRPTMSCPPTLKKWSWMWQMCHRRPNG